MEAMAASGRTAHSIILYGEKGTGRRTIAGYYAQLLMCRDKRDGKPCGVCPTCRTIAERSNPDVFYPQHSGKLGGYSVETISNVARDAYVKPNNSSGAKVYIFTDCDNFDIRPQNKLLKLIEEGPAYAAFLFLTPNPELLLPTIRSRCETLRAPGEEEQAATEDGKILADYILTGAAPAETLPFLVALEKRDRGEISALLAETAARLTEAAKENPSVLAVLDRLDPIRAACEFNISAGHLAGWIASVL